MCVYVFVCVCACVCVCVWMQVSHVSDEAAPSHEANGIICMGGVSRGKGEELVGIYLYVARMYGYVYVCMYVCR